MGSGICVNNVCWLSVRFFTRKPEAAVWRFLSLVSGLDPVNHALPRKCVWLPLHASSDKRDQPLQIFFVVSWLIAEHFCCKALYSAVISANSVSGDSSTYFATTRFPKSICLHRLESENGRLFSKLLTHHTFVG